MPKKIGQTKYSTVDRAVTNKTFQSHSVPYEELDEEAEIKKALESDKIEQKEKELLERELEKPFHQRNRALMNKYRGRITESLDGYPSDIRSGGYDIVAVARDDPDLKMNLRPQPWYVKVKFENNKNNWEFKFPIKREPAGDGAEVYKLDGYNTWIYRDGSPIDSISEDEVTPYTILWRYHLGYSEAAKQFLIDDDVYNFNFPGFYVTYTRDQTKAKPKPKPQEDLVSKADVESESDTEPEPQPEPEPKPKPKSKSEPKSKPDSEPDSEPDSGSDSGSDSDSDSDSDSESQPNPKIQYYRRVAEDKMVFVGEGAARGLYVYNGIATGLPTIDKKYVRVYKIIAGKRITKNLWLCFEQIKDGVIYAVLIDGTATAATYHSLTWAKKDEITDLVKRSNKEMLEEFKKINP